jgi:hypothetical protein
MTVTPEAHINALVADVPDLRPMLDERLHDHGGELLPHLFYADVMSWAEDQASHPAKSGSPDLKRLLNRLDDDYRDGNDDLRGLIEVSFLWGLSDGVYALLGPSLRAVVETSEDPGIRRNKS